MATLYFPIPPCRQLPLALIRVFAGGGTKMERVGYPQMHIVRSGYRAEVRQRDGGFTEAQPCEQRADRAIANAHDS